MRSNPPQPRQNFFRAPDARAWALAAVLAVLAAVKLSVAFDRLLSRQDGAVDLAMRAAETRAWFEGKWKGFVVYPPASQALFWPAVGWLPFEEARGLWALVSLGCLAWLAAICMRECGLRSTGGRVACALLPLAMSATSSAVAVGQVVHVFLPVVTTAVLLMARGPSRWADSAGAATLFTIASVKPTLFAPFAWLVLALPRKSRTAILSGLLYFALTIVALSALDPPESGDDSVLGKLVAGLAWRTNWATRAVPSKGAARVFEGGYGNLQNLSQGAGMIGLQNFVLPVASVLACGAWLLRRRRGDPWILLAVCAIAARLGWYHRIYDDMLIVLPVIALVRVLASRGTPGGVDGRTARIAAILLAATLAPLLWPGSLGDTLWNIPKTVAPWTWLADLVFFVGVAPAFDGARAEAARGLWLPGAP